MNTRVDLIRFIYYIYNYRLLYYLPMERMKLTEKEKEQILKSWAEAMSKIIERMSIEMWELEEENKKLKEEMKNRDKYRVEENKRLRKWIDIRLDSIWVKYIMTEEWDCFTKSDFKITE